MCKPVRSVCGRCAWYANRGSAWKPYSVTLVKLAAATKMEPTNKHGFLDLCTMYLGSPVIVSNHVAAKRIGC